MYNNWNLKSLEEKDHVKLLQLPNFSNIQHCRITEIENLWDFLLKPCLISILIFSCFDEKTLKKLSVLLMDESCLLKDLSVQVSTRGNKDFLISESRELIESIELNKSLRKFIIEGIDNSLFDFENTMLDSLIANDTLLKLTIHLSVHCSGCNSRICKNCNIHFFVCTCNRRVYTCSKCEECRGKIEQLQKIVQFNAFVWSRDFFHFCQIFHSVNFPPYVLLEVVAWLFPTLPSIYTEEINKKMHRFVIKRITSIFSSLNRINAQ